MAILCDESIFVQVIEKCLCVIFGFLFSSIHVSMDASCHGNNRVTHGIYQFPMSRSHGFYWLVITCGSKPITRSQTYYFGKGLQVFFRKITFTCKWICEWFFSITCSKKYLNFLQCIACFFVSHYWINMNFKNCTIFLHIQCFILKINQNFKSSSKIKFSHLFYFIIF
jgi:hypothetical protein